MEVTFIEHQLYQHWKTHFLFFLQVAFSNEDTKIQSHMTSQSQHSEEVTDLGHEAGLSNSLLALYFANYITIRCFKDRK